MQLNILVAFCVCCFSQSEMQEELHSLILQSACSTVFFTVLVRSGGYFQPELWQNTLHNLKPYPSAQSVFLHDLDP